MFEPACCVAPCRGYDTCDFAETQMNRLMTIGYEQSSLDDFILELKQAEVTTLLDIREIPISRRKGFSKTALRNALESEGIRYRHERELGSPKLIRQSLHGDGDYPKFFAAFTVHLKGQRPLLQTLVKELTGGVALMCFERDASTCHRSVVARHLQRLTGLPVSHLEVASGRSSKRESTCTR